MQPKHLTTSSGRKILLNTPEEDAAVNAGIANDPDTYELGATEFKKLKVGRPLGSGKKVQITLRIDEDIVVAFKNGGPGWQTRINDQLKRSLRRKHA